MAGNPPRKRDDLRRMDLDNKEIALAWISGLSHLDLSIEFDCNQSTISNRLREARIEFPDLPWGDQRNKVGRSSIKQYTAMKDGKPGESRIPEGSVIRSAAMRRR